MLFALIGFYGEDAEERLPAIAGDVNEFLGQFFLPPRLAGVFRGRDGKRIGNLVLIDSDSFEDAEKRLKVSPALNAGLYERSEIAVLDVEIGDVKPG